MSEPEIIDSNHRLWHAVVAAVAPYDVAVSNDRGMLDRFAKLVAGGESAGLVVLEVTDGGNLRIIVFADPKLLAEVRAAVQEATKDSGAEIVTVVVADPAFQPLLQLAQRLVARLAPLGATFVTTDANEFAKASPRVSADLAIAVHLERKTDGTGFQLHRVVVPELELVLNEAIEAELQSVAHINWRATGRRGEA